MIWFASYLTLSMLDVLRISDMPTSLVYDVSTELIQKDEIYEQSIIFILKNKRNFYRIRVKECWRTRLRHCVIGSQCPKYLHKSSFPQHKDIQNAVSCDDFSLAQRKMLKTRNSISLMFYLLLTLPVFTRWMISLSPVAEVLNRLGLPTSFEGQEQTTTWEMLLLR